MEVPEIQDPDIPITHSYFFRLAKGMGFPNPSFDRGTEKLHEQWGETSWISPVLRSTEKNGDLLLFHGIYWLINGFSQIQSIYG